MITKYADTDALIILPHIDGYCSCNTGMTWYHGEFVFQTRYVSYTKHFTSSRFNPGNLTLNQNYVIDKDYYDSINVRYTNTECNVIDYGDLQPTTFRGFEDPRLIVWDDKLYVYGCRADCEEGLTRVVIYEGGNCIYTKSPNNRSVEKNWMAIPDKPLHFIYDYENGFIEIAVDNDGKCNIIDKHTVTDDSINMKLTGARGSTPLAKTEFGYMTIVHKSIYGNNKYEYRHAFVIFDNNLNITQVSDWFTFHNNICEFCCGMSVVNDMVYITYSQLDAVTSVMSITMDNLMRFIQNENHCWSFDMNYYKRIQKSLLDSGHIESARVVSNYILTQTHDPLSVKLYMDIDIDKFLEIKYK